MISGANSGIQKSSRGYSQKRWNSPYGVQEQRQNRRGPGGHRQCVWEYDCKPVPTHLPLAWTHSSAEEIQSFMTELEKLTRAVHSQLETHLKAPLAPSTTQLNYYY